MRKWTGALALLLLAACACQPAGTRKAVTRESVFSDDFASNVNDWEAVEPKAGAVVVQEGSLLLVPDRLFPSGPLVAAPGSQKEETLIDVSVEAEITFKAGQNQNAGVVCRGRGYDRRYAFTIDSLGSYEIGLRAGRVSRGLAFGHHPAIVRSPNAKNKVRGDCHRDVLSMYVNDQLVGRVRDATLEDRGFAGLRSSWINQQAEVNGTLADNFAVSELSGTPTRPSSPKKADETGREIFEDDFSVLNPGWLGEQGQRAEENVTLRYSQERMEITVSNDRGANVATSGVTDTAGSPLADLEDVSIEADVTFEAGSPRATAGLQCRRADPLRQEYYVGLIYPSRGEYAVIRWQVSEGGQPQPTFMKGGFSSRIKTGRAINRVRLDCIGSSIKLAVNGYEVTSARDTAYKKGDLAMLAESSDGEPTTVYFDNLVVRKVASKTGSSKTPSPAGS